MKMLKSGEYAGANEVARALHSQGLTSKQLHKATIIRHARAAATLVGKVLKVSRARPPQGLGAATIQKRLGFAKTHLHTDFTRFMFTDRCRFYLQYPGSKVQEATWYSEGERPRVVQPSKPANVNVYMGITTQGVTGCHVVAGTTGEPSQYKTKAGRQAKNITQEEYPDVLMHTLLPGGDRLLGHGGSRGWVLQQDNDPTHRVAQGVVQQWRRGHNSRVELLANWPPNSPDLNPIENVWSWVGRKVKQMGVTTLPAFKQAVLQQLAHVPKKMLGNLVGSMQSRLRKVIEKGGDRIKY
jgi:hypothetical protein